MPVAVESGPKTTWVPREVRLVRPRLVVLTGAEKGRELVLEHTGRPLVLGQDAGADFVLAGLSPRHAELVLRADGVHLKDLSAGATSVNGTLVHEAVLEPGSSLALGEVELRLQEQGDAIPILPSTAERLGPALGRSLPMREVFGLLEAIAPTEASVLLLGETGTGKDVIAHAIHEASPRSAGPMLTLDCGAIAPSLIEAELFGHERGAFTGAEAQRLGAFERAAGGTLFLDEIGELPLDVQPRLLRAIDEREIRRVGGSRSLAVDVRVVSATKRDLEEEVARGRFREDLYFRVAVVPVRLPPLRERREDIPMLVEAFAAAFEKRTGHRAEIPEAELRGLGTHDWPGNVRELKNTVERALWLAQTGSGALSFMLPSFGPPEEGAPAAGSTPRFDPEPSFSAHKKAWEEEFEKKYLAWLLARADGSISLASRLASMDRKHLRGLLRKHGLAPSQD